VILLDLMMPIMDGWQFLDELRKTSAAGVPVIVLTATEPGTLLSSVQKTFRKPVPLDRCSAPSHPTVLHSWAGQVDILRVRY